jgi:hypothetical protein
VAISTPRDCGVQGLIPQPVWRARLCAGHACALTISVVSAPPILGLSPCGPVSSYYSWPSGRCAVSTADQQEEPSAVGPICGFILANGKHSFISLLRWGLVNITLVSRPLVSFALLCATPLSFLCPRSLAFTFAIPAIVGFRRLHSFHLCIRLPVRPS